ncbi:type II toxin-antitoxin system RelE/ParE family toxin [Amorphus sp. 3PC139-8]|uniref:type II toxin-antitoxin system RelE/ParE family toxin n=1 Tax=Amorphus sp. 3PC139-8 TaxID=2735676 RepID=UPI00345CDCBA
MSDSRKYLIRPKAEEDLRDIGRYTRKTWGREQTRRYLRAIHDKLQRLSETPEIGAARDEIAEGYRSARVGHHLVFYRIDGDTVVVRVLHESMDLQCRLDHSIKRERGYDRNR